MDFSRDIGYLDYFYNGLKMSTVGMVKWQRMDNDCSMELYLRIDEFNGDSVKIFLQGVDRQTLFREIKVEQGAANLKCFHLKADELLEGGGSYEDYNEVYIPLETGWYISGQYRVAGNLKTETITNQKSSSQLSEERGSEVPESVDPETVVQESVGQREKTFEKAPAKETSGETMEEEESEPETTPDFEEQDLMIQDSKEVETETESTETELTGTESAETEPTATEPAETETIESESAETESVGESQTLEKVERRYRSRIGELQQEEFGDTKWETLYKILPKRIPFEDERRFLECMLEDLIYLSEKNFKFCKNPFLLYGYRQYGHLLLGRIGKGKSHNYLLGVPGVYHPQEIQAALNYGFESFEGIDKKQPEGQEGRQGYYFTKVSL